jgi:hypothetical protein
MSRTIAAIALALGLGAAGWAQASPATDEFGRCLVAHTDGADRASLMVWMFTAFSAHPAVKPYANVTDAQRGETARTMARLLERLVTVDCRKEALDAIRTDGPNSIRQAFQTLVQVAIEGLMQDPAVAKAMGQVTSALDMSKFQTLGQELLNAPPKD